jgi:DNA-directed RNA polymerase
MDTNVSLMNPIEALKDREIDEASRKLDIRDERAERNVGYGATVAGMKITNSYLTRVTEGVVERLSGSKRPRKETRTSDLERLLLQIKPVEKVGLCLLQAGLHAVGAEGMCDLLDATLKIGASLNDELWASKLLQTDKKLAHKVGKQAKERFGSVELRRKAVKKAAEDEGFRMQEWSDSVRTLAGEWGIQVLQESMPLVFSITEPVGYKETRLWTITDFGMDMAKDAITEAVLRSPVYQPRTDRPKDWETFVMRVAEDDRTMDRAQLMRTHHKDIISAAKHGISTGAMAPAIKAVNVLQSVPFKLNTWIMDVIDRCYEHEVKVEGLPFKTPLKVPARLPDAEFAELPVEQRRLLAKQIRGLKRANRSNVSDTVQYKEDMETASLLAQVDRFFTPMNMDWRTRVYSLARFNFQREDRVRSMFLFANGKPIGEEGIWWLKVHVANCGAFKGEDKVGIDKKDFDTRVKWVDDHLSDIIDYVKRPLYRTEWVKADSPFLFLASCRELLQAIEQGPSYITHMPTSWDGACNGVQHMALMTRAPEGELVNLTDVAQPNDVYQVVADRTKELILADLDNHEQLGKPDAEKPERKTYAPISKLAALALAFGVDRKLVKRNCMTFSYASSEFGMGEQHFEDTMAPLELKLLKKEIEHHPFGDTDDEWRLASRYLANRVRAAIVEVLSLPAQAMKFMQKLAKTMAHEGKPLKWMTPAGVTCINRYHENTMERVSLWLYDNGVKQRMRLDIATGYEKAMAKDKCAAGIAANLTHSMDASHLLLSVGAAADEGITDIATVHDSFGCLACDAPRFITIIRSTLKRMYEDHDVLTELLESARADLTPANHWRLDEAIAIMPQKGTLDLEELLNARYAFA